jgi:hypothetical protein
MQPVRTPVSEGRLALWDTTGITDGTYQLRLQVWLESGNFLESIVRDLKIKNMSPTQIPTAIPAEEPVIPLQLEPSVTPQVIPPSTSPRRETSNVLRNFVIGGIVSIVGMISVGGYLFIRKSMQMRVAKLRMRQVHRRFEVQRGRKKK